MRITENQRKDLSKLIHYALVEIRFLILTGKAEQAAELADGFHNIPKQMWDDDFSLEEFRDNYLAVYQKKFPEPELRNYVETVNKIIAMEEDYGAN
jgi:hypothetical protein